MWIKSQNSEKLRPSNIFEDKTAIIVRRNFNFIEEQDEEHPAHWEYEEWQMSKKQYEIFLSQQADVDFLTMENEFLIEENEQQQADIDYLLMITEEL
jgi:hypothetical protein